MHDVSLVFFWHQHQPYYPDDTGGDSPMPWVRLHGVKDYWGMAMLLKEIPELHATINLVPSLLVQLLAYTDQGHEDRHLRLSRLPADMNPGETISIVIMALVLSYLATIYPAWRAARLDPVEALRYG